MNKQDENSFRVTNRMVLAAAVLGTCMLLASLIWNWHRVDNTVMDLAQNEARAYFEKDLVYRSWAAEQSGVYVSPTETSPPNPYLGHLPDRDVTTWSGKELTLINPAYMTRQVHELGREQFGLMGHITSLDPIRKENAADEWETRALLSFQEGAGRASSLENINEQPYLRFMQPLFAEQSCLSCHARQGYAAGDIIGGISVSVPMAGYLLQAGKQQKELAFVHIFIGIFGLTGLGIGHRILRGTEMKLLESRENIAATLDSIGDGVISCDKTGRILELNPAAQQLTAWAAQEAAGRPLEDVFHVVQARTRKVAENPVKQALRKGESTAKEKDLILIDGRGKEIFIEANCAPIYNRFGSITGAVLVFRDVTREYTANLLTRKRLELYDFASSHSLDELLTKVLDDAEEFVNSSIGFFHFVERDQKTLSLQRWSTRALQELCHMPGIKMHYDIDQAGVWVEAVKEKRPVIHNDYESLSDKKGLPEGHAEVIREIVVPVIRDNMVVAVLGLGNKPVDYDKKDLEAVSFFADVTWDLVQKKRTEIRLQESEARLRTITDSAQDAIIMIDSRGLVSYWNPGAEKIFGFTSDEVMEKDLHQLIMPGRYRQDFKASFAGFQETGQGSAVGGTTELKALTRKGQEITVDLSLSSVFIAEEWHAIGIVRDITDKKEAEQKLQNLARDLQIKNTELDEALTRAEAATKAKSEFLANMSHEIRTPMNGVIGMTSLLLDTDLDREQQHYAQTVRVSAESLLTVINDILDFSKIEAGRLDIETLDFDLEAMLRDFAGMMAVKAEEKGLELICSMDLDVPALVRGDPGRVRQILLNLVDNAIKFTETGEVEIRVQKAEVSSQSTKENAVDLVFKVRDTGIGIPRDKQDVLFQSFSQVDASVTRKYGGTGLGLAISRQLAGLMGGEAGFDSQEGQGSIFWFSLCLELQERHDQRQAVPGHLHGVRTLIVDDNSTNREILMTRLASWGMRPEEAGNGPSALDMLYKAHAGNDPFLLAVLDMQMPDMDGDTLGRTIKADEKLRDTRLVMMSSAAGRKGDAARFQQAGFSAFLTKPVLHRELYACLAYVLKQAGSVDTSATDKIKEKNRTGLPDFSKLKARILVAEDNQVNQQVALGILKKMGISADAVANGGEVLQALQIIPYDLVFMDVHMPEMDGLEATRRIRVREEQKGDRGEGAGSKAQITSRSESGYPGVSPGPRTVIVAMTAGARDEDRERCFEAGMDDYVAKPVNPDELGRILARWLSGDKRSQIEDAQIRVQQENKSEPESGDTYISPKPVFDQKALMERVSSDDDFAREILTIYVEKAASKIQSFKTFIAQENIEQSIMDAHSIKGIAANSGCLAVSETARQIENAGRSGNIAEMKNLLPELERQHELSLIEVNKHFNIQAFNSEG